MAVVGIPRHTTGMSGSTRQVADDRRQLRTAGYWAVMLLTFAAAAIEVKPVQARCRYQAAAAHGMPAESSDARGLSSVFRGRWQYVGGSVYFVFHPQPIPCDGPFCKSPADPPVPMEASLTHSPRCVWGLEAMVGYRSADGIPRELCWHYPSSTHFFPAAGPLRPPCCRPA